MHSWQWLFMPLFVRPVGNRSVGWQVANLPYELYYYKLCSTYIYGRVHTWITFVFTLLVRPWRTPSHDRSIPLYTTVMYPSTRPYYTHHHDREIPLNIVRKRLAIRTMFRVIYERVYHTI